MIESVSGMVEELFVTAYYKTVTLLSCYATRIMKH